MPNKSDIGQQPTKQLHNISQRPLLLNQNILIILLLIHFCLRFDDLNFNNTEKTDKQVAFILKHLRPKWGVVHKHESFLSESAVVTGEESPVLPIGRGTIIQKAGMPPSLRAFRARKWMRSSPTVETLLTL